jgi:hypothetical protein
LSAFGPRCFSTIVEIPSGPIAFEFLELFTASPTSSSLKAGASLEGNECKTRITFSCYISDGWKGVA